MSLRLIYHHLKDGFICKEKHPSLTYHFLPPFSLLQCRDLARKSVEGGLEITSPIPVLCQSENYTSSALNKSARDKKEPLPYTLSKALFLLLSQDLFLEPVHQVIAKHYCLKPEYITGILMGDHVIHPKGINPFLDHILTVSPLVVKFPNLIGAPAGIGSYYLIIIEGIIP